MPDNRVVHRCTPAAYFLAGLGGLGEAETADEHTRCFRLNGEAICYFSIIARGNDVVELRGLYAGIRGGARHAMACITLLADIAGVKIELRASSIMPNRITTDKLVLWFEKFGFVRGARDEHGRVHMTRRCQTLVNPVQSERSGDLLGRR